MIRRPALELVISLTLLAACGDDATASRDAGPAVIVDAAAADAARLDGAALTPDGGGGPDSGPPTACTEFADGVSLGNVESPLLTEISGVVASRRSPGVLWVHNDSGEPRARFFALREDGTHLGEYTLVGARFSDWEDVAIGPGPDPGRDYLYWGDVGDNAARGGGMGRPYVSVYRVAEPDVAVDQPPEMLDLDVWDELRIMYPDGAHDCETVMIDPTNGDLYLVAKENDGVSGVFRATAPIATGIDVTVEQVATIRFGTPDAPGSEQSTAGEIAPNGASVIVRTYGSVLLWVRGPGQGVGDAVMAPATVLPMVSERQGEAVCFTHDSAGYFTISEGGSAPVHFFDGTCAP